METTNNNGPTAKVRLYVRRIPWEAKMADLVMSVREYGKIHDAFLSAPEQPDRNNAGWAILVVDEEVACKIVAATILVCERVVRITRAAEQPVW